MLLLWYLNGGLYYVLLPLAIYMFHPRHLAIMRMHAINYDCYIENGLMNPFYISRFPDK